MGGPFSAQFADLHTVWRKKKVGKNLEDWGSVQVSKEGYLFWTREQMLFSLCQFRDNVLLACNLNPGSETNLVQKVCSALSTIWDLEVLCDCLDSGDTTCKGKCLAKTVRALGISMIVGCGTALGSMHPAALTADCHCYTVCP